MTSVKKILWLILGLLAGAILAFFIGVFILFNRVEFRQQLQQTQQAATSTAQMAGPQAILDSIFNQAEVHIANHEPAKAQNLLLPLVEGDLSTQNYAHLYADLAQVELEFGHTRLACENFKKSIEVDKYPEGLYVVAEICYKSGQLTDAMRYYEEIVNWEGKDADEFRDYAQYGLETIRTSLGTKTP